jgi:hypothetical protein
MEVEGKRSDEEGALGESIGHRDMDLLGEETHVWRERR